jgi:hypothetical protein
MKKIILLASCLIVAANVNAQEKIQEKHKMHTEKGQPKLSKEDRAQKNVDNLNSEVTLTEDQKAKVKALALERITKIEAIKDKYKGQKENKPTAKTEIEAVKKEYHKSTKALLTAEQLEKLKAKHKQLKAEGKENALEIND